MNITISLVGLIGQYLFLAFLFLGFASKFMNRISKIESKIESSDRTIEVLRRDLSDNVMFVKFEFGKSSDAKDNILDKLDSIKDGMQQIKVDVVEIKSQLKYQNGDKI